MFFVGLLVSWFVSWLVGSISKDSGYTGFGINDKKCVSGKFSSTVFQHTFLMLLVLAIVVGGWRSDFPIPTEYSLLLVGSVLGGGVALSLNKKRQDKEKE